jgi:hypothetical protein
MITPKEKAKEMIDIHLKILNSHFINEAKQCALIAVNLLIEQEDNFNTSLVFPCNYWKRVKKQIEKI